jgi:penicillin-binding protein 2
VPIEIPDSIFEAVHDGMQGVMETGTGRGAKVPGITICGKTGTVENYAVIKGQLVKQPNHSFFCAFAPRENPTIAIMCVVENSGRFGGTYAAPIVSLMIEKYLNDTIATDRKPLEERMINTNLIPPIMVQRMRIRDSLKQVKLDSIQRVRDAIKDTLQSDDMPDLDAADIQPVNPSRRETPMKQKEAGSEMSLPGNDNKLRITRSGRKSL